MSQVSLSHSHMMGVGKQCTDHIVIIMNIEWDYDYYQPWSNNEWLINKMLAMLDKDITMQ